MPTRRACLALAAAAAVARPAYAADTAALRGFNVIDLHDINKAKPFRQEDFRRIRDWGFTFVRLPIDYRCAFSEISPEVRWNPAWVGVVDSAIEWAMAYGLHANLAYYRAPGYCVKPPPDRYSLWRDREAQHDFYRSWEEMARRYKAVSPDRLSFNLLNEPDRTVDRTTYARISEEAIRRIHAVDARRTVTVDGLLWGTEPVWTEATQPNAIQSTRGYKPDHITHFRAGYWNKRAMEWPTPTWPLDSSFEGKWDDARIQHEFERRWGRIVQAGKPVHVGEFGAVSYAPHDVTLAWMAANLKVWNAHRCGWALWEFRGPYGIIDSQRADVRYRDIGDGKLDGKMLDLLRS